MWLLQSYIFAANLREESVSVFPLPLDARQHSNPPYPSLLQGRAEQAPLPQHLNVHPWSFLPHSVASALVRQYHVTQNSKLDSLLDTWTHMWLHGSQVKGNNHFLWSAGCALASATQPVVSASSLQGHVADSHSPACDFQSHIMRYFQSPS